MTRELRLILGDQLDRQHPWFQQVDPDVCYVLMEVRSETDYVVHHIQKVVTIFLAMRQFATELQAAGHRVRYLTLDDPANQQSLTENVRHLCREEGVAQWSWQHADERRVEEALQALAQDPHGPPGHPVDSTHFLIPRADLDLWFKPQNHHYLMEAFYRRLRQHLRVLMTATGDPEGGQWNYDTDNRSAYDGALPWPMRPHFSQDARPIKALLAAQGVTTLGHCPDTLDWPLTPTEASQALSTFIDQVLVGFGRYQDALVDGEDRLFHSLLSVPLNLKILHPLTVIRAAEEAFYQGRAPLAAVEGFIRQILGWREYMRGLYWRLHPTEANSNYFAHDQPLPGWFWTGQTRMRCLAQAIDQSLQTGYAHHIQRLMVTGNFALLAGVAPSAVNAWYLGIYVDAFEWVQWPNTHGMSQHADGGRIATKPYIASGAYLSKQGDHCAQCAYRVKDKTGAKSCPFNSLYWHFVDRHQHVLLKNPRIAMPVRSWLKRSDADRAAVLATAEHHLAHIESL